MRRGPGLLLVGAAALLARLFFVRINPVNYDGYWHVFIARHLPREIGGLAHPPLFPALLHLADAISPTRLSYLSISIAAGVASVVLFGLALRRLSVLPATPLLGALALALSPAAITLSGVAESYMLCTAFLLAAFRAWLDLLAPEPPSGRGRARAAFAAFSSLALLSHYAAGIFLVAALSAPLAVAGLEPDWRAAWRRAPRSRPAGDVGAFLVPAALGALLFGFLARPWVHRLNHLEPFYFAAGSETAGAFLLRTLASTFDLFAPLPIASPPVAAAALLAFVAAALAIAVASDRRRRPGIPGAAPAVLLALLLLLEAAAALLGRYPFGGAMRHQFLLLLFGTMAAFVALDRILAALPPAARRAVVVLAAAAIAANWWGHLDRRWTPRREPFAAENARFDGEFADAREVHVDQFNLVGFFAGHHDWTWEFLGPAGRPGVERYRLTRGGKSLEVVAHRDAWNFDPAAPDVYRVLADTAASSGSETPTLYAVHQTLPDSPSPDAERVRQRIPELARAAGLETVRLDVVGPNVFATFRRAAPTPIER